MIARVTQFNAHPDEFVHVDAFEYFRIHWLRPPPGSPLVYYSAYGWSRVFTGEIVYLLYGKIGAIALWMRPGVSPYLIYRYCNIGLLFITLTILVSSRRRLFTPWVLAMTLMCVPQVIYVFSYANSDAFGLGVSVLLFLQTVRMLERPAREWSLLSIAYFMLLFLCTVLSKTPFLLGLLMPLVLLPVYLAWTKPGWKFVLPRLVAPIVLIYIFTAWWNPQFSPWHAQWHEQMTAMRQDKAVPTRKPHDDNPAPGIYLINQHWTYTRLLQTNDHDWIRSNGQSVYGRFGYMNVVLPDWIYATAAYTALGLLLMTLCLILAYWRKVSWTLFFCVASAPLLIGINVFGSMYHSLYIDYQPQGRYLFAALPAVFFLCFGTWPVEGKWWRFVHATALFALFSLSCYVSLQYVIVNHGLR